MENLNTLENLKPVLLTETHRHFLQFLMKKGFCEEVEAKKKLDEYILLHKQKETKNFNTFKEKFNLIPNFTLKMHDFTVGDYINSINQNLAPINISIKKILFKPDRKVYYGLRNEVDDEFCKLSTFFEVEELEFFQKILDRITEYTEQESHMGIVDVYNERNLKKMTLHKCEMTVKKLIRDGWLHFDEGKKQIWFGVRTCIDLPKYVN